MDDGARHALESSSKSLLAIGILEVVGEFEKGDVIGIRDGRGANSPAGSRIMRRRRRIGSGALRPISARRTGRGRLRRSGAPR